ncbi:MAG: hypothetical protein GY756_19540 [bacterium]|nr:hypothetical protein [bacterium]
MSDLQNKILEIMKNSSKRGKTRISIRELSKKAGLTQMKIKKDIRILVENEKLSYWSSGSTNYIMLQEDFINMKENDLEC